MIRKRSLHQPLPDRRRSRPVPDAIVRYHIPRSVLDGTGRIMREYGAEERECYIWWGGFFDQHGHAQIVTALCPDVPTAYGCVHLTTRELLPLHEKLRALDQVLLIELHTHPPDCGGQNDVDAAHPAATYSGFISVVVPDFGLSDPVDLARSFVYEYLEANRWRQLSREEVQDRFLIEETFLSVQS